ncbi:hypothetical protein HS088_TW08G00830 [Tripterygium wilfordii]|uniref:DUF7812 domain-containing protein n=1 Tax=Tripterygium wilfordii TaxID=458696 RepID=A0A7J7DD11_TRIWF|nr:uncharacterized protein LOC120003404 [Tripterygium wilfordii]KAF5744232.1 hypothetical protein HS088_TW08G00830 [Tripterygium wilfordii]
MEEIPRSPVRSTSIHRSNSTWATTRARTRKRTGGYQPSQATGGGGANLGSNSDGSTCEIPDQGLQLPIIKSLYYLLVYLSRKEEPLSWINWETTALDNLDRQFSQFEFKMQVKGKYTLSSMLFKELDGRFRELFSDSHEVSASLVHRHADQHMGMSTYAEGLTVLLRCCMVILTFLGPDHHLRMGQDILSVLSRLISICISQADDRSLVASTCISEPYDPCRALLCTLLEVSADELLAHKNLREYLIQIDSASENIFKHHFGLGVLGCVLELISAHFILSVSNELAYKNFITRLYWSCDKGYMDPEMSLSSSLALLLDPIILSAPKMFLAHLILLVSESIGIGTTSDKMRPDFRLINYHTAFERSVTLYAIHIARLHMDGKTLSTDFLTKSCMLGSNCQPIFETFLSSAMREKLFHVLTKPNDSCDSSFHNMSSFTKLEMVAASIAYVKESLPAFDITYKVEILSILHCIILRVSSDDINDAGLLKNRKTSPEDMYLMASLLKLMSCSMLQILWCLSHRGNSGSMTTLKDVMSCKEYEAMMGIIGCFQQYSVHLPVQKFLYDIMESHPSRHKESKWMLLHFSGLLSFSYVSKIDFLVKDCIFAMMVTLILFTFEEGNLDALSSMLHSGLESCTSSMNEEKVMVDHKCSKTVASNFHKNRMHLRRSLRISSKRMQNQEAETYDDMESASIGEESDKSCNGESFLRSRLGGLQTLSDVSDLVDFIKCQSGKDYSLWLKNREKFRQWKLERVEGLRRKKKNGVWKYLQGRKV